MHNCSSPPYSNNMSSNSTKPLGGFWWAWFLVLRSSKTRHRTPKAGLKTAEKRKLSSSSLALSSVVFLPKVHTAGLDKAESNNCYQKWLHSGERAKHACPLVSVWSYIKIYRKYYFWRRKKTYQTKATNEVSHITYVDVFGGSGGGGFPVGKLKEASKQE